MAKCKFKVGDRVKPAKDNNYGITGQDMELGVVTYVGQCGQFDEGYVKVKILKHKDKSHEGSAFLVKPRLFEKIGTETIVIYSEENKVTALDKSTGKKATARCNSADKFNFHTGAKLAFSRLMGEPEENQQDKPKIVKCDRYEVGDKVLIRDWDDMVKEFGTDINGNIRCRCCFTTYMKEFCNEIIEIREVSEFGNYYAGSKPWTFSNDMIAGKVVEESEKPVEEFKPYLEDNGTNYGIIGEETPFKDEFGRPLRIGDTVEAYDSDGTSLGECSIVSDFDKKFVMGMKSVCGRNGEIVGGFKVVLKRRYEDIADGKTVGYIKYIKSQG